MLGGCDWGLSLPGFGDGVDAAVVADWAVAAERAPRRRSGSARW